MNMYTSMKINYINSPFIKFKAMLLSVFTTSSAMPGCHTEQLEFLVYGLRFARFYFRIISLPNGLGAKSQILSSVAPPRKKKLATIFSQGHVWGPQKPMFY